MEDNEQTLELVECALTYSLPLSLEEQIIVSEEGKEQNRICVPKRKECLWYDEQVGKHYCRGTYIARTWK